MASVLLHRVSLRLVAGAAVATLGLNGCSGSEVGSHTVEASDTSSVEEASLWSGFAADAPLEKGPRASTQDLAEASDLIVLGRVVGLEPGRDYTQPEGPPNPTTNVTVEVLRSSGAPVQDIRVEMGAQPAAELRPADQQLPQGATLFFLQSWYEDDHGPVYACTSAALCVVGPGPEGKLTALRAPDDGVSVLGGEQDQTVEELYAAVTH